MEHFIISKRKPILISSNSPTPLFPCPGNYLSTFVTMHLPILDISYKGYYIICMCIFFLSLASFTWHDVYKVYPCSFFLWLNNFPFMDIQHFVYSSVDELLNFSTFWLLQITLLWTLCTTFFMWTYAFNSLGYISKSGIAQSFDNFWGIVKLFSKQL